MSKQQSKLSRWAFAVTILIALLGAAIFAHLALAAPPPQNLVGPGQARPATHAPDCDPSWNVVDNPSPSSTLYGIAVVSADDVWSVGTRAGVVAIMHWDGSVWSVIPAPQSGSASQLNGVAALSASDVWAVGTYNTGYGTPVLTLIEHWNGSAWSVVPSPNPGTDTNNLNGISAVSASDIWAVGYIHEPGTSPDRTLVEHWDGAAWSVVASDNVGDQPSHFIAVAAISDTDVWAVGYWITNSGNGRNLIEHWDGVTWTIMHPPNPGSMVNVIEGIDVASADDVWVVGNSSSRLYGPSPSMIEHWDGSVWSVVPNPNPGTEENNLYGIAIVSTNDVWAVGTKQDYGSFILTLTEHWDGSAWSVVPSPNLSQYPSILHAVAKVSTDDVYAVGEGLIEQYTPCVPTPTPTPEPTSTPVPCIPGVFSDVPADNPFYLYVTCLVNRNIISGYSDCTFRPGNNVTRAQLAKIVSLSAGYNDPAGAQLFEDVPSSSGFFDFVQRLGSRGIIGGYTCGGENEPCVAPNNLPYYRPGNNVTRGQISKIVAIAATLPAPPQGQWTFTDVPVGSTFWTWVESLATAGSIGGYPCGSVGEPCDGQQRSYFRPGNSVTRGQSSKIVANTFFPNCQTSVRTPKWARIGGSRWSKTQAGSLGVGTENLSNCERDGEPDIR